MSMSRTTSNPPLISEKTFSQAYRRDFGKTVRFLRSRGVSEDRAEEFAQGAWAKGWERLRQLHDPRRVGAWVNTIAFNLFRNQCRKPRHDELPVNLEGSKPKHGNRLDAEALMQECSDRDRRILKKFYVEGYESREIAEATDSSAGAIRIRLMRARRRMRQAARGAG